VWNDKAKAIALTKQMMNNGGFSKRPRHKRPDGREPLGLLQWTMLHRPELRPNVYLDLVNNPYLIGIMNCTDRHIVLMKAGQIRITEYLISYALHGCDERFMDVAYIMPTHPDLRDMSQQRVRMAIEASPYLASIVGGDEKGKGKIYRGVDNMDMKRVRDNTLTLRSGNVGRTTGDASDGRNKSNRLKSFPADGAVIDEYDEMPEETLPLVTKRFGASPIKELRIASTPSYFNTKIHAEWLRTDQREWFVRCPHCGRFQMLTIEKVIFEYDGLGRPSQWHGKKEGRAFIACENKKCGKELNRMAPGEWVPTLFGREKVGFHPTKLMSSSDPSRPDDELMIIIEDLMKLEQAEIMQAWNQHMGLPWSPKGGKLTDREIELCKRPYSHGPKKDVFVFMGGDISPTLKHIVIRYFDQETGDYPQLYAGTVTSFEAIAALIEMYGVEFCVLDGAPETEKSRELQAMFADGRVWLAYFSNSESQTMDHVDFQAKEGRVRIDRTRSLDAMYARWFAYKNVIPANISNVPDYLDEIKAPTRVIEKDGHGNLIARYTEGSKNDHFAFAELYAYVASKNKKGWFFA